MRKTYNILDAHLFVSGETWLNLKLGEEREISPGVKEAVIYPLKIPIKDKLKNPASLIGKTLTITIS